MLFSAMLRSFVAVSAMAGSIACHAGPVTWNLQGISFNDGGTAAGSFVYDANTNAFTGISIVTSVNGPLGTTYGVPTGVGSATFFDTITTLSPILGSPRFLFDLLAPMTNAGGTIGINLGAGVFDGEGICSNSVCSNVSPFRTIISGSITTVPEPATLGLVVAALAAAGLARRRAGKAAT